MNQKTIQQVCSIRGVGVHSGEQSLVQFKPAAIDSGIVWVHVASGRRFVVGEVVPVSAPHATVLADGDVRISTIEHVMAALWACGIVNVVCELHGDEVPIMDGSSLPVIWALQSAGIVDQAAGGQFLNVKERLEFVDQQRGGKIVITPPESGDQSLYLDYKNVFDGVLSHGDFVTNFASARTCGAVEHLPMLRSHGLARGSTLGNTIATANGQYLNTPRFKDEPQRHKVLDLIGDLYLLGKPLAGRITATNTGHSFNRQVVAHYVQNQDEWKTV